MRSSFREARLPSSHEADHGSRAAAFVLAALLGLGPHIAGASPAAVAPSDGFPLRSTYPDVRWISTEELADEFESRTVVDVRSELEYDVVHIKGAINNPVAHSAFGKKLKKIAKRDRNARIVFYCNGHTCAKSYKAVRIAAALGYTRTVAYDAGIFEWTKAHPEKAVLIGKTPADPNDLLSDEEFRRHQLAPGSFIEAAQAESAILIDVRDPMQRQKTPDFGDKAVANYYMEKFARLVAQERFREQSKKKDLYVFDAAGKQVRWLQYHLEDQGYENYYFLEGGVWSIFGAEGAN